MAAVTRERIESAKNDRLKSLLRLHERRERRRRGRTLVEGVREIGRAVDADVPLEALWIAPGLASDAGRALAERVERRGVPIVEVADAPFARLSRRQAPDGLVAVARPSVRTLDTFDPGPSPLLLVAVGVEKPGNLGALIRSADAASAAGVIVVGDAGTDPWNPGVVRASMGSVFALPIVVADAEATIAWAADRAVPLVATSPAAEAEIWDADLAGPVAVVLGPEHEGLSARWLTAADARVRVPMSGAADSLNVSVTGALLLFEAMRQRRGRAQV